MKIRPIKTEAGYVAVLSQVSALVAMHPQADSPEGSIGTSLDQVLPVASIWPTAWAGAMTGMPAKLPRESQNWAGGATALALLLDGAVGRVEKRLLKWQPPASQTEKL